MSKCHHFSGLVNSNLRGHGWSRAFFVGKWRYVTGLWWVLDLGCGTVGILPLLEQWQQQQQQQQQGVAACSRAGILTVASAIAILSHSSSCGGGGGATMPFCRQVLPLPRYRPLSHAATAAATTVGVAACGGAAVAAACGIGRSIDNGALSCFCILFGSYFSILKRSRSLIYVLLAILHPTYIIYALLLARLHPTYVNDMLFQVEKQRDSQGF